METPRSTPHPNIKVLIIDDSSPCAAALQVSLEECGITNIIIASSGKIALEQFSNHFDIIITDLRLPDINGIDLTTYFRVNFPKKDTPIICCSSEIEKHYQACIEAGINDFLEKPISTERLKEILACWIVRMIPNKLEETL